jgi:hypothetical protein
MLFLVDGPLRGERNGGKISDLLPAVVGRPHNAGKAALRLIGHFKEKPSSNTNATYVVINIPLSTSLT